MTTFFKTYLRHTVMCVLTVIAITGCAGDHSGMAPAGSVATTTSVVSHYGKGIVVAESYLNGGSIGYHDGWGGGGGTQCCVSLRSSGNQPTMVTVKWETYRDDVNEDRWHEQTVPVHFAVPPGKSSGLYVHFLPGHKVEVWVAREYPENAVYPGPVYPHGPAPAYIPLPDEKPSPVKAK